MPRALPHISCSRAFTSIAAFPRFYLLYATPHCPVCLVVKVVVSHKVDYKYYRVWRVWIGKGDDFGWWMINGCCIKFKVVRNYLQGILRSSYFFEISCGHRPLLFIYLFNVLYGLDIFGMQSWQFHGCGTRSRTMGSGFLHKRDLFV